MAKAASAPEVIVVLLRRPRPPKKYPKEKRSDPFWEFGSFGVTGCHGRNLMHPKNSEFLTGKRFAFVQGGPAGFKLVYLTPAVKVSPFTNCSEARWARPGMPFCYDAAPLVVSPEGESDIPALREMIVGVNRNGWEGRFASKFRTRKDPLPDEVTIQLLESYESARRRARSRRSMLATAYNQALPCDPAVVDTDRDNTYRRLLAKVSTGT